MASRNAGKEVTERAEQNYISLPQNTGKRATVKNVTYQYLEVLHTYISERAALNTGQRVSKIVQAFLSK